jgi:steroid 5-alpha reductase family enzyme
MNIFWLQAVSLLIFINIWFVLAVVKKRNDIADVAWGLGFILLALIGFFYNPTLRVSLISLMVIFWGIRLSYHIGRRFLKSSQEDARYQRMRSGWKGSLVFNSWLRVFLLQGINLLLVASSIIIVTNFDKGGFGLINAVGIIIWSCGLGFEIIGDQQLKKFISKAENKGKIMTSGLWKYTRHPNYFGEAVLWWGLWLVIWGVDYFYIGLLGPITITVLLRFVSGVPLAEERYKENSEFKEYALKTPPMLPNFFIK